MPKPLILRVEGNAAEELARINSELKSIGSSFESGRIPASKFSQTTADTEKNIRLETQALMALRNQTAITADMIKNMSEEQLRSAINAQKHAEALAKMNKAQGNVIPGMEGMSQWMQRFHMDAAHYAAMIDRITGLHTGLATVLRSGFIPSLIAIGVAMAAVNIVVHQWKKGLEEADEQAKKSGESIIEFAKNIGDLHVKMSALPEDLKKFVIAANAIKEANLAEEQEKNAIAVEKLSAQSGRLNILLQGYKTHVADVIPITLAARGATRLFGGDIEEWLTRKIEKYDEKVKQIMDADRLTVYHDKELAALKTMEKYRADALGHMLSGHQAKMKMYDDEMDRISVLMEQFPALREEYRKTMDALRAARDKEEADEKRSHHSRGKNFADEWRNAVKAYELDHADAYRRVEIETKDHIDKLNELMKKQPQHRKEILAMIVGYNADALDKIWHLHEEAESKIKAVSADTATAIIKQQEHLTQERERAYGKYVALVGTSYERIQFRVDQEKREWIKLYHDQLVSRQQLDKALHALDLRALAEKKKIIDAERKAKVQAAFSAANAIVSVGEMTKNKQVQQLGQLVGVVEKVYKAWEQIHAAIALFRKVSDAEAAMAAIRAGTSEKSTQAGMASLEAQVNAYNSAAAIPMVGWILAPAAMAAAAAATAPMSAAIQALGAAGQASVGAGQAHKGMSFDRDGSYLMNVKAGETIVPNTQGLMDLSSSITKLAAASDSGASGGGQTNIIIKGSVYDQNSANRMLYKAMSKAKNRYGMK